ncbi:hypothetical protein [Azohydromonas australica]|uniref:hypothetical protein n=1 Tax=Azohydromonas australica TaxID=364039 RepID=UPI0012EB0EF2|nr:hypothetical protein [Azohydromonas australica]
MAARFPGVPAAADAKATPPGADMEVGDTAALAEPPVGFKAPGGCRSVQFCYSFSWEWFGSFGWKTLFLGVDLDPGAPEIWLAIVGDDGSKEWR